MFKDRNHIADLIVEKLIINKEELKEQFNKTKNTIGYFYLDNLLPENLAYQIHSNFPELNETIKKKNLREYKYLAYQMDKYNPLLEEVIYAFQDPKIVKLISEICDIEELMPDDSLYAGGLSLMAQKNYLNPHLDNSHDKDRNLWRVLNLLYYVTPNWKLENGGNLELWTKGVENENITLVSKFNRLVVMATHQRSWHSVSKVNIDNIRCCVSNYYFSSNPLLPTDSFHVTSFRAEKNQKVKDFFLQLDTKLRSGLRRVFKKGLRENPHKYKKPAPKKERENCYEKE